MSSDDPGTWELRKVDAQRWMIVDPDSGKWAPMPRVVYHGQLQYEVAYGAMMAPRKVAAEALEHYRRGEQPPIYRQTARGLEPVR